MNDHGESEWRTLSRCLWIEVFESKRRVTSSGFENNLSISSCEDVMLLRRRSTEILLASEAKRSCQKHEANLMVLHHFSSFCAIQVVLFCRRRLRFFFAGPCAKDR